MLAEEDLHAVIVVCTLVGVYILYSLVMCMLKGLKAGVTVLTCPIWCPVLVAHRLCGFRCGTIWTSESLLGDDAA